jgi:hypothetical protein
MKTRSSSAVGTKVELQFDTTSLRITDIGDDDASVPTTVDILHNNLKRQSNTIIDKETGEVKEKPLEPKVRTMDSSGKLNVLLKKPLNF